MTRPVFHLSLPVSDLERSAAFYRDAFGAEFGRMGRGWRDVWAFGGQITLQHDPDAAAFAGSLGRHHFGATVSWDAWTAAVERMDSVGVMPEREPLVLHAGEPGEQAKVYVRDPDGWTIELKAYRDPPLALERPAFPD